MPSSTLPGESLIIAMRLLSTMLLACLFLAPSPAAADGPDRVEPRLLLAQRGCTSLGEAVEQVRRRYGGRIVSAETRTSGNREVHVIRVMTDEGEVRTVTVPGCTRGQG